MNSSGLQHPSSTSIPSRYGREKEASAMIQSRRAEFFANYKRQNFSLPESIMFYMATNAPSSKVYQTMIESCKYFFVTNPVLVIPKFNYHGNGKWEISDSKHPYDLSVISSKLWLTDRLNIYRVNSDREKAVNQNILSSVMPKLYQCNAKFVSITDQIISFRDLSFLISCAEDIDFYNITVRDEDDSNVAVEKIVEVAVKAKEIEIRSLSNFRSITSETMKNLLKISHFSKLDELFLSCIPEAFDFETFYSYMKQNKTTKVRLYFHPEISDVYKTRLEETVDEILATKTHGYKPPHITFAGLSRGKWQKLNCIFFLG